MFSWNAQLKSSMRAYSEKEKVKMSEEKKKSKDILK